MERKYRIVLEEVVEQREENGLSYETLVEVVAGAGIVLAVLPMIGAAVESPPAAAARYRQPDMPVSETAAPSAAEAEQPTRRPRRTKAQIAADEAAAAAQAELAAAGASNAAAANALGVPAEDATITAPAVVTPNGAAPDAAPVGYNPFA